MAFDQPTRNLLQRTVAACRNLLAGKWDNPADGEFTQQLQQVYGISPDGTAAPLSAIAHLPDEEMETARILRQTLDHYVAGLVALGKDETAARAESVSRIVRDQAFTVLNRLAALRLAEERGLVLECVRQGMQSEGFQLFQQSAQSALGTTFETYQAYLSLLFDELATDVGSLFDRWDPHGLLFPRQGALEAVLAELNGTGKANKGSEQFTPERFAAIWREDETIGWIYQYYNDPAERKKMRDDSAAPRNSRELAVRNQFFTPRYVVEFLTDNTLGRLWYEMTKGKTSLRERCRYLMRHPVEIFLPSPETTFWHDAPGQAEFRTFCSTAQASDLPESPALGILFGWISHLTTPPTPYFDGLSGADLAVLGFSPELRKVGIDPISLIRKWEPFLSGEAAHLDVSELETIELLHLLWSMATGAAQNNLPSWSSIDPVSTHEPTAAIWRALRICLQRSTGTLSQEEMLRQPVFIPHRPLKDPREIRLLDPACGSMHFGLYAFDLLEIIYEEAWEANPQFRDFFPQCAIDPATIRIRSWENLNCDASGEPLTPENTVIAISPHNDPRKDRPGRLFFYHRNSAEERKDSLSLIAPLAELDWTEFLNAGWVTENVLSQRLNATFSFQRFTGDESLRRFRHEVPRLIIERNLHGIDIDPRAAQIAGLSLWLRAQRAWEQQGLGVNERPQVRRSHIVCAEPMPGEKDLLRTFVEQQFTSAAERGVFLPLFESISDLMKLAGEAGSLLQIEEDIRSSIADAKRRWKEGPRLEQASLFDDEKPAQVEMALDFSGITDEQFWEKAEERIYDALRAFAESAGGSYQRRLFVDDAARGFAFIDLCRKRYDVALMNPPFGDASLPSKPYIEDTYGDTKGDVYKAFVECFHARLVPAGYLGIISSRTGFFLSGSEDWRTRVVLRTFRPIALADLGSGVLDAMVEVAAYVLRSLSESEARNLTMSLVPLLEKVVRDKQDRFSLPKWQTARGDLKRHQAVAELEHLAAHGFIERCPGNIVRYTPLWNAVKKVTAPPPTVYPPLECVRALAEQDKGGVLSEAIRSSSDPRKFICHPSEFARLPGSTFSYWATPRLVDAFTTLPKLADAGFEAWVGLQTNQDFRWLRLWWEVNEAVSPATDHRGEPRCWLPFAKGGEFAPVYCDIPLVVLWGRDGRLIKIWKKEQLRQGLITENNSQCWNESRYKRPGLTWPRRTNGLSFRVMPEGCIFGDKGPAVFSLRDDADDLLTILALLNSAVFVQMVGLMLARVSLAQSFEVGIVRAVPVPPFVASIREHLYKSVCQIHRIRRETDAVNETSHAFLAPSLLLATGDTLAERAAAWAAHIRTSEENGAAIQAEIDDLAFRLYGLAPTDRTALTATLTPEAADDGEGISDKYEEEETSDADATTLAANLLTYALGCAFGRWDIRFATGERSAPEPPHPFDPLPVCPPGMLQNAAGFPAAPSDVPVGYPLRVTWPGILVDDEQNAEDIERRVREVLAVLFPSGADAIADQACILLGAKSLREWLRKPAGFFADHLKRYSKSRRQAPIYWPLSTPSGSYTLWLYYHRLTPDTLFKCLQDFVEPKLRDVETAITRLRTMEAAEESNAKDRKQLEEAETLRTELHTLRDELTYWAPRWKPNLNDGVQITASPLFKLFRLPKWQKLLETTWKDLSREKYEWAHLALTLWPDRVRKACESDRSLAVAHGLEELCEVVAPEATEKGRKKKAVAQEVPQDA